MILTYEGVNASGRHINDTIDADTVKDGLQQLRRKGVFVTHIGPPASEQKTARAPASAAQGQPVRMSLRHLVLFTRQMAMLLGAGSAVVPALQTLVKQTKNPHHIRLIKHVVHQLEQGTALSVALQNYPRVFSSTYCAAVAAGEASGALPEMFNRLAAILGRRRMARNHLISLSAYPALLIILCLGVTAMLIFFVMPRFAQMFANLGAKLPAMTEFMIKLGVTLNKNWPFVLAAVAAFGGCVFAIVGTDAGRRWLANVQTRIPVVGSLFARLMQAEAFRTLGMLIEARVGLIEAIELTRGGTKNAQFRALYDKMEEAVTSGGSLSSALEQFDMVSPSICQAVRTGEETGQLGLAITYAADILEEDNREIVMTITKLAEPVILLIMGALIGTMAVSLFMPLFDMTSTVQG